MQSKFRWSAEVDDEVKHEYNGQARKLIKGWHWKILNKYKEAPKWLSPRLYEEMKKNAETSEFKEVSTRSKKNRRGGKDIDAPVAPSHCQGSISTVELANRLVCVIFFLTLFSNFTSYNY